MCVSNLACLAVLALALGSCKKESVENPETGSLVTKIMFERNNDTRANKSTAIPETSWSNIKQIQVFLYDKQTGVIKFSDMFKPVTSGVQTQTWAMVPAGTYQLVLVANVKSGSDNVETTLVSNGTPVTWTGMNVRNMPSKDLGIYHAPLSNGFPTEIGAGLSSGHKLKAYGVPSEIFMAYSKNDVTIKSGEKTDISSDPLTLKREVSLMRVRLRVNDKTQGYDNTKVDFASDDASVLIYTLPEKIGIRAGNDGGVSTNSSDASVLVAASGKTTFSTTDPTSGYAPAQIIDTDFKLWRDIVVFPNNGGRKATAGASAPTTQRYYVVVTGHAPENHLLSDGTTVKSGGALVHWSGLVEHSFEPNTIRELNLNLTSGGTLGVPSEPAKEGGLVIKISEPAAWDSNIKATDLEI
jgi:hypothetical protein